MIVVIAGGGRTGAQLARILLAQNHEVHLIEDRKQVIARLHKDLPTEVVFEGRPIEPHTLELAGISEANILAACTGDDEINLTLCFLARSRYKVPRTIARINNPRSAWLFDSKFHVDVAVSQAEIMASIIEEEMSLGDMMTLLKLRRGNYSLVEEKIPQGAPALNIAIKDLDLPDKCVIAAIMRNGEIVVPRGITKFEAGDEILAVTDSDGAHQLEKMFTPSSKLE